MAVFVMETYLMLVIFPLISYRTWPATKEQTENGFCIIGALKNKNTAHKVVYLFALYITSLY